MFPSDASLELHTIGLSTWTFSNKRGIKDRVVVQVCGAARQYGFFHVHGHGIPVSLPHGLAS
ncbi:hypothetical protein AG0111_0g7863 [Alternaria gaisen]|uniref:Uncharacterized protein n=1 Tax=Alternaria gaisen TaxID=167740 RepID=A0ACB6FIJ1_9PLEO|nr:hypothetical protein AG0111_0g7863 [Alternaria gaisen]